MRAFTVCAPEKIPGVKHFRNIDGLRAWLAWTVVLSHVTLHTGADIKWPVIEKIEIGGVWSVCIFIIISGFVITHLLVEKQETYLPYISRRFLRIYPIYFVCLWLGIGATYLHIQAFSDHPWGAIVPQPGLFGLEVESLDHGDFLRHVAAHLLLLHGMISSHVLPASPYMFLGPAWSLSLEWQFYLLAPLILVALRSGKGRVFVALATVAGYAAYQQGWLGQFFDPSFLPGAGLYFAAGIATRLLFNKLPEFKTYPLGAMIIALGFCLMSHALVPFVIWAAFVVWLRTAAATSQAGNPADVVLNAAFNSKTARYLGTRSYSTYLIHEPIIHSTVFLCIKYFALGLLPTLFVTLLLTVSLTLIASIVLYRVIEAPAIAFGKRLFVADGAAARADLSASR
jgi:peptidoglycan/LPS O-acetylase OafA/YrhL